MMSRLKVSGREAEGRRMRRREPPHSGPAPIASAPPSKQSEVRRSPPAHQKQAAVAGGRAPASMLPQSDTQARRKRARSLTLNNIHRGNIARRLRIAPPHTAGEVHPRTQQEIIKMLEADTAVKASMSPFCPLPAIGRPNETRQNNNEELVYINSKFKTAIKKKIALAEIKKTSHPSLADIALAAPKYLVRENTYDLIEPVFLKTNRNRKKEITFERLASFDKLEPPFSKLESIPETGRLLTLRKRDSSFCKYNRPKEEKLHIDPESPESEKVNNLSELSEIFNSLQVSRGQCRSKVKKENNWF